MTRWVRRLRDPESKQRQGRLKWPDGGMCAVGHLCEALDVVCLERGEEVDWTDTTRLFARSSAARPPHPVEKMLGCVNRLTSDGYGFTYYSVVIGTERYSVVYLNDDRGLSLPQIADAIEADWLNGQPLTCSLESLLAKGREE